MLVTCETINLVWINCLFLKLTVNLLRGIIFWWELREQTWLATHHCQSCSQLCSRALRLGRETMKRYRRALPGPFAIGPFSNRTDNPHFTIREITKSSPRRVYCKPWVQLFGWELQGGHIKYYICPAPLHQPQNYPPKQGCHMPALQGTLWLHL